MIGAGLKAKLRRLLPKKNYLWVVLDSVTYDAFLEAETPNMHKVGTPEKVYTAASWTLPSFMSLFVLPSFFGYDGYILPCHKQSHHWKPLWLQRQGYYCGLLTCNVWMGIYRDVFSRGFNHFKDYAHRSIDKNQLDTMIDDCLKLLEHTPYFIVLHIMETHAPYYHGSQKAAIEYVDAQLGRLFNGLEKTFVAIFADHGDLAGFHAPDKVEQFEPSLFEIPLITGSL